MKTLKECKERLKEERTILYRIRDAVKEIDPSAEVILYGSRARGDAESDSDYDLLILSDSPSSLKREDIFRNHIYPIEVDTGAVLTVFLINKKDWRSTIYSAMPFYQNVERDGIRL